MLLGLEVRQIKPDGQTCQYDLAPEMEGRTAQLSSADEFPTWSLESGLHPGLGNVGMASEFEVTRARTTPGANLTAGTRATSMSRIASL